MGAQVVEISEAGVEFEGKLELCYRANLWLRTAGRVLCRLPGFRAGSREELFARACKIPWELWLPRDLALGVQAYVVRSRLRHTQRAAQAVRDAIRRRLEAMGLEARFAQEAPSADSPLDSAKPAAKEWVQRIFVRIEDNRCVISLDTTGPHLHQRGYRIRHTGAPLRETLAAAILQRAGWDGRRPLVDGMCGSGTLAIEAAWMGRGVAPGRNRGFLFERWPSFQQKTWNYLLKKADEAVDRSLEMHIVGIDRHGEALRTAADNARRAQADGDIRWVKRPFESFRPEDYGLSGGLVVLNPPYGVRLSGGDMEMYRRILHHLAACFGGWDAAVIAPVREFLSESGVRPDRVWKVRHGGLTVHVGFYRLAPHGRP
ncbi:putative N6-adenine-specific DNA methylase [Desulfacinum hydrothermale DSM 13146]|uniref:Putative N6-adenine-specific DNA methylase n=2 Tax=Desulfacinum hydrothermale TaxID=109258 RepID=A0A1W1X2U9_9BACT|nr:putative N6-adenine-specific DNA methylase [Desulfacinum hydrothermale DSM 13146]